MIERLAQLKKTIEARYPCAAWHVGHTLVELPTSDDSSWNGQIEIFRLVGHPHALRCYAWSWSRDSAVKTETILELPPVNSAEAALQSALDRPVA